MDLEISKTLTLVFAPLSVLGLVSVTEEGLSPHGGNPTTTNSQRFCLVPSSPEDGKHRLSRILRCKLLSGRLIVLAWDRSF